MSTRIALVSDTHTWRAPALRGGEGNLLLLDRSEELLATLLTELRSERLDHVIHLGDMTCGGGYFAMPTEAFLPQIQHLHEAWSSLGLPLHALPGNHDCPPGAQDGAAGWRTFESLFGLAHAQGTTLDVAEARLILVNAQGHGRAQLAAALPDDPVYGWIGAAELARVEDALQGAQGRPILLFIHQLLYRWHSPRPWREFYAVRNGAELISLLDSYPNVRAIFQGHAHRYEVAQTRLGGAPCHVIISPAVIEYPVAWLLLELDATGLHVTVRPLPCESDREESRRAGGGQDWRLGDAAWGRFDVDWSP